MKARSRQHGSDQAREHRTHFFLTFCSHLLCFRRCPENLWRRTPSVESLGSLLTKCLASDWTGRSSAINDELSVGPLLGDRLFFCWRRRPGRARRHRTTCGTRLKPRKPTTSERSQGALGGTNPGRAKESQRKHDTNTGTGERHTPHHLAKSSCSASYAPPSGKVILILVATPSATIDKKTRQVRGSNIVEPEFTTVSLSKG